MIEEPETLDWNRANSTIETHILLNLMEGLVEMDQDLKPVPALAESWEISEDGRTYTFKLRQNIKWSDGVPLKAADFVYSWKRLLSPSTGAPYASFLFDIEGAEWFYKGTVRDFKAVGIKAIDDRTFQVKLTRPVAHWIFIPTFWVTFPLREDIVSKYGNSWDRPGKMVSLGPYLLAGHEKDSRVILKENPTYYRSKGNISDVQFILVKDDMTALRLFDSGKLDFVNRLPGLELRKMKDRKELKYVDYLRVFYIGFIVSKFPATDPHVRRAIAMAIDLSKIPQVMMGKQQSATSYVPPGIMGHSKKLGLKFDPEAARQELKLSGLDVANIKMDFLISSDASHVQFGEFVQSELRKNLGLNVRLQTVETRNLRTNISLKATPMYFRLWAADFPDPDNFLWLFTSNNSNNLTTLKNEKYDEMIVTARHSTDKSRREKIYLDAQKLLQEELAAVIPVYYDPNVFLLRTAIKGLELNPINYLFLRKANRSE